MARINTDGGIGLLATPGQGAIGACLLVDCLGGMDDPAKWDWRRKIKYSRKLACRRFVFSPPHSPGDCIQAALYPCPSVPSVVPVLQDFQIIKIIKIIKING